MNGNFSNVKVTSSISEELSSEAANPEPGTDNTDRSIRSKW